MKDKQRLHFPHRKCPSHWFWICGWHRVHFVLVLAWLCTKAPPAAQCGYWPVRQHRAGLKDEGREIRGKKERHPSVFLELTGLGWVYCREKEVGRRERGWVKDDRWAARCMSYRVAESVPVCLSVLTLSKSICPLWNCGHREGEASRWAGSGETTANTKPGHTQTQKPRLPSDMTSITYKFNWIWASF